MCSLYSIRTSRAALARKFRLSDSRMAALEPLPAIFPDHLAPKHSADGEREMVLRTWGFILLRDGYAPKRVTNTRDDKARTKFWKDSFETRRCLVPATAFCEPDESKPARWHWFALNGASERPLFAFAGVYRQWKGPVTRCAISSHR
jgi:putative SOS response-associated peptidase YedK